MMATATADSKAAAAAGEEINRDYQEIVKEIKSEGVVMGSLQLQREAMKRLHERQQARKPHTDEQEQHSRPKRASHGMEFAKSIFNISFRKMDFLDSLPLRHSNNNNTNDGSNSGNSERHLFSGSVGHHGHRNLHHRRRTTTSGVSGGGIFHTMRRTSSTVAENDSSGSSNNNNGNGGNNNSPSASSPWGMGNNRMINVNYSLSDAMSEGKNNVGGNKGHRSSSLTEEGEPIDDRPPMLGRRDSSKNIMDIQTATLASRNSFSEQLELPPVLLIRGKSASIYRQDNGEKDSSNNNGNDGGKEEQDDEETFIPITGYKVIETTSPTREQVRALVTEEQISNFLPQQNCSRRRVLQVKSFMGKPCLYFEWAKGITLKEWFRLQQSAMNERNKATLKQKLQIAIAISKTLAEFHKGQVSHQNLSLEHILLDIPPSSDTTTNECYQHVEVSLISLSHAVVMAELSEPDADLAMKQDLYDLGVILKELFATTTSNPGGTSSFGEDPLDMHMMMRNSRRLQVIGEEKKIESNQTSPIGRRNSRRRSTPRRQLSSDMDDGLPLYLTSLLSTLMLSCDKEAVKNTQVYNRAHCVLDDLRAAEKKANVYLKPVKKTNLRMSCRLRVLTDAFYARESELSALLHSFDSVVKGNGSGEPTVTCVSGYSGSGKTSLINQILTPLREANGYFIQGKFDPTERSDSVLIRAFDDFFGEFVDHEDEDERAQMRTRIQNAVGSECSVLVESIPNLARLMGHTTTSRRAQSSHPPVDAPLDQWQFLLCKLIGSISDRTRPIIFFCDDLQWADDTSLDSLRFMVMDPETSFVHYIASYRDDKVEPTQRINAIVDLIDSEGVNVTRIKLGTIDMRSINDLLSENLSLPPSLCASLAHDVYQQTGGVILFVSNYLRALNQEDLLKYNILNSRWEYDIDQIQRAAVNEDRITHHLTLRMSQLEPKAQLALQIASCFKAVIDTETLEAALAGLGIEAQVLDAIESFGFLRKLPNCYMWDRQAVHSAAYELISEKKKKSFHLLIGSQILVKTPPDQLDAAIVDIVHHLNIGAKLLQSEEQQNEVAQLNLFAARRAIKAHSFHSAANYLSAAISIHGETLDGGDEGERYNFLMEAYGMSLKPLFVIGDLENLEDNIHKTMSLARSSAESNAAFLYLARVLAARGRKEDAIAHINFVLQQHEEAIPELMSTRDSILDEVKIIKEKLSNLTDSDILALPIMSDERVLTVMHFLQELFSIAFLSKPMLLPTLISRMVKLTLNYGLCKLSSIAFAGYGSLLVATPLEDFDLGYRMGCISFEIMKKFDDLSLQLCPLCRSCCLVHSFCHVYPRCMMTNWRILVHMHRRIALVTSHGISPRVYNITNHCEA